VSIFAALRGKLPAWWPLGDFLVWWVDELRTTLASLLEVLRIRDATRLTLYIEGERLTLCRVRGPSSQELGILTRDAEGRWPMTLPAGDSTRLPLPLTGSPMTVVLAAGDVLVKELVLPAAAEKRLDQVLAIQAVREFPLAATQLYLDHRVVRRIRATRQIVVHLRAARRAQIDELSRWALSVGGRLDRVCCRGASGEISGNFLPRASWRAVERFSTLERRLAAGAAFLLLATVGIVGAQWWFERHQVNAELVKIRGRAQQVRAMWKDIEAQSAPATYLIKLMSVPDAATVVGGLPDSLPMDTWASQIEIRAPSTSAATVNLSAFAPAATKLVDELARSSHFKHVHLIYAASDTFLNRGDRVQLSAEWVVPADTTRMLKVRSSAQGSLP
jgi:general secretion pathway protein L